MFIPFNKHCLRGQIHIQKTAHKLEVKDLVFALNFTTSTVGVSLRGNYIYTGFLLFQRCFFKKSFKVGLLDV